jgi:DNA-binding NtrC family response regulator
MPIEKIIVLEDDLIVRKSLEQQLRYRRYDVASASTIAGAQELLGKDNFDLMIVDVKLPDGDGTELLKQLQLRPVKPLVVMISGFGTVDLAVECMSNGAFTFLTKPFSPEQLAVTLKKAEEHTQLLKVNQYLSHAEDEVSGYELLGQSQVMEELRQLIRKVARTQATVLIQGESGTGKELVARALYRQSPRSTAPFIKLNCAAIPENLIESEFFGHEKGAFTGAINKREGRFELAHSGTILLDEISEISPRFRPSCCACCRNESSSGLAAIARSKSTCASLPLPIAGWKTASSARNSGRTCISGSTSCRSWSCLSGNVRKTSPFWPSNSGNASPANTASMSMGSVRPA